jgi:hypothetical protein
MLVDEDNELTVEDIQETETELGIDIDEIDYHCTGYMIHW